MTDILRTKHAAFFIAAIITLLAIESRAAEVIPPKPDKYFNDYAGVVSKEVADRFNEKLPQFERETSDQAVVAVFPKMQSDSDVADYTQRVAQTWGVGQNEPRNGVAEEHRGLHHNSDRHPDGFFIIFVIALIVILIALIVTVVALIVIVVALIVILRILRRENPQRKNFRAIHFG